MCLLYNIGDKHKDFTSPKSFQTIPALSEREWTLTKTLFTIGLHHCMMLNSC